MKYFVIALASVSLLSIAATSGAANATECKACELNPVVNNVQVQDHAVVTAINALNVNTAANITADSTAVGNNLSMDGSDTSYSTINNNQAFGSYGANVSAALNVQSNSVDGDVALSSTAIANNAQITVGTASVLNNEQAAYYDPSATTVASLGSVAGDLTSTTTAVANNLSVTGRVQSLSNSQSSTWQPVTAVSIITAQVGGSVNASATAIGNNVSLKTH